MELQLSNPLFQSNFSLRHTDQLFFIGSCFSETLSKYFEERKFRTVRNPHGIIYNPYSLVHSLNEIANSQRPSTDAFLSRDNIVQSFHHHSSIHGFSENELNDKILKLNRATKEFLTHTDVVFVTLGTAWVFWHKELQQIVANNLKAPADLFEQRLLSIDEIKESLQTILQCLTSLQPNMKVIWTISPVRHAKQGLSENNRSKARLIEALHQTVQEHECTAYLPTYELVLDVLRDYRFYKRDLVHPNDIATDFIWDFVQENLIDKEDDLLLNQLKKLSLAIHHKLFYPTSSQSKKFIKQQLEMIQQLHRLYPYIELGEEKKYFEKLLLLKS